MIGLSNNKEFLRLSIFILWLINVSGFFGILSDQKDFFLSTSPYVLTLTFLLLILNHELSDKKSKIGFHTVKQMIMPTMKARTELINRCRNSARCSIKGAELSSISLSSLMPYPWTWVLKPISYWQILC